MVKKRLALPLLATLALALGAMLAAALPSRPALAAETSAAPANAKTARSESAEPAHSTAASVPLAGGTLDRIAASHTILLGYRLGARPFSFRDDKGKAAGYSIDLCRAVAAQVKVALKLPDLKLTFVPVSAEDRFDKLVDGRIDLLCGATTETLARLHDIAFSSLTFVTGASLLTRKDSGIAILADLEGRKVGVIPDTTTESALRRALEQAKVKPAIVQETDYAAALAALEAGRIDAYASDRIILIGLLESAADPAALALAGGLYSHEPYALALRPGDHAFLALVNRALSKVYGSDAITRVYDRWFGAFGARPSELLRALYLLQTFPD